ncbi:MAG: hypothetical protein JNL98_11315 [Bryobacterales bacterium]|nr:hypothetical protein [Bryobacterales bacterium]
MTLTLNLPPHIEQAYLAEAQAKGVPLDELVLEVLIARQPVPPDQSHPSLVELDDGMWALRSGQPLSVETVNDTIDALRRERDLGNSGQAN